MNKKNKVRNYYDQFSNDYEKFYSSIQNRKYQELIDMVNSEKPWIMDHGGGTGLLSEWIQEPIITLDISFRMLQYGIKKNRDIIPIVADMEALPIRSKSISVLFSITSIQNTENIKRAIIELERIRDSNFTGIISYLSKAPNKSLIDRKLNNSNFILNKISSNNEDEIYFIH